MTIQCTEALQRAVLDDIRGVLGHVPMSFDCVTLSPADEGSCRGVVGCSEAGGHRWDLQLLVSLDGEEVVWELESEPGSHRFRWR